MSAAFSASPLGWRDAAAIKDTSADAAQSDGSVAVRIRPSRPRGGFAKILKIVTREPRQAWSSMKLIGVQGDLFFLSGLLIFMRHIKTKGDENDSKRGECYRRPIPLQSNADGPAPRVHVQCGGTSEWRSLVEYQDGHGDQCQGANNCDRGARCCVTAT